MITIICGLPGTGKTALAAMIAISMMTGVAGQQRLALSRAEVERLNSGGYNYTLPTDHVVYADITITAPTRGRGLVSSWALDGFQVGLHNPHFDTVLLPPYAFVVLDEAQRYYNSRVSPTSFPPEVSRFYEIHRHNHLDILMTCQRPALIDKTIRGIAQQFLFVEELSVSYDIFGRVSGAVWHCKRLGSSDAAERYSDSGELPTTATEATYWYYGNIFLRYDSYCCMPLHYAGRGDQDFDFDHNRYCAYDRGQIDDYGDEHTGFAPQGYYVNTRKRGGS